MTRRPRFKMEAERGSFWLLTRSPQADEDDPQFSHALSTDTPEKAGVKLAELDERADHEI